MPWFLLLMVILSVPEDVGRFILNALWFSLLLAIILGFFFGG